MRAGFVLGTLLAVVVAASCASAPPAVPDESAAPEDAVVVEVVNNSMADMDIYAWSNVGRGRLGRVGSLESNTLEVPRDFWATGSLRIQAVPVGLGGRAFATGVIQIQGGQSVRLTLEADPALSSWRVDRGS